MRTEHSTIHNPLMRQRRMAYIRGKLLETRRRLLERMEAELTEPAEPAGVPGDPADMAHSVSARETSYEIGSVESRTVAQIDYMLQRIDSGKYGICEDCGKRIPAARLRAMPFAYLCVECKQRDEQADEMGEAETAVESLGLGELGDGDTGEVESRQETIRGSRPG
ncbi:MAG: TraR/DksA family transcriptional regulator [Candidatus Brocadiia bacterium]